MFVDEIIRQDNFMKWKANDKILIKAPTGSGKSHFMLHILARYYNSVNRKVLIFSNRSLLREQNKEKAEENVDCINYQYFEKMTKKKMEKMLGAYDVLCFDECHYFFSDSSFNDTTDNVLRYALEDTNQLKIFASATPEPLYNTGVKFRKEYKMNENFSFIEELTLYEDIDVALEEILNQDKKALCFFANATKAFNFRGDHREDVSFICSKGNVLYRFCNKEEMTNIVEKNKFEKKILATTTVLDNGVSLLDDDLGIVLIDVIDPISIIQMLGRKRLKEGEKIKVYLKIPKKNALYYKATKKPKEKESFTMKCYKDFICDYTKLVSKLGFISYWVSRFKLKPTRVRILKKTAPSVKEFLKANEESFVSKNSLCSLLNVSLNTKVKTINSLIQEINPRYEIISKKKRRKDKIVREWFLTKKD